MQPSEPAGRLRVGIEGEGADAREWSSALGGRADVTRAGSAAALLTPDLDLVLLFASAPDAPRAATEIAALPSGGPAVALLIGGQDRAHPLTRLVRTLLDAKSEWEATFDAIVDPVAVLDREGSVVRANLGLGRAFGKTPPEILSLHYRALLGSPPPDSRDPIALSLADGVARAEETRFPALPGVVQVTASPLADGSGELRGLVVILKDMSGLKDQQERLLQASRLADIGQLAAGVAHEINTPLASIALRAESLLKASEDPRLQAIDSFRNFPRYLKTIDEEIFRCKKIIGALLEFSRRRKPEVRETDLNTLAENAADLVAHQMRLKQVDLALRLDPGLPRIRADDGQLRQALIALLMNALDATPSGGRVEVETRANPEGTVTLTVSDSGIGIPRENLDRIFNPFFTTKPVGQGTGLGLAMCHGIVASHGGEIRVESEPNRGTRLSLILPPREAAEGTG